MNKHIRDYTYIYLIVSEITFKIYCLFFCSRMLYNIIWIFFLLFFLDYYMLLVCALVLVNILFVLVIFILPHKMNELCLNVCRSVFFLCVEKETMKCSGKVFYYFVGWLVVVFVNNVIIKRFIYFLLFECLSFFS